MSIGKRIKSIRLESGLSQADFAISLETSRSNIGQIEAGNQLPTIKILSMIVRKYNKTYEYLIDGNTLEEGVSLKGGSNHEIMISGNNDSLAINILAERSERLAAENALLRRDIENLKNKDARRNHEDNSSFSRTATTDTQLRKELK